ncbi:MAG TPA: hypothetical protein PL001_06185 [Candidatus Kryptobacter bacterium]|nr:hypothetical protein [Candidatus Kryptobacter bacterium]
MAEGKGYRATMEAVTPDGNGRVDVGLEKDGKRIAFEVSVTTDEGHELHNVKKCLAAGYDKVVVVSSNTKNLERIRSLSAENLADGELSKVTILQTKQVPAFFEDGETLNANREETIKGYRVKLQYPSGSRTEANNKRQAVADVILRSMQRFKNNR